MFGSTLTIIHITLKQKEFDMSKTKWIYIYLKKICMHEIISSLILDHF